MKGIVSLILGIIVYVGFTVRNETGGVTDIYVSAAAAILGFSVFLISYFLF